MVVTYQTFRPGILMLRNNSSESIYIPHYIGHEHLYYCFSNRISQSHGFNTAGTGSEDFGESDRLHPGSGCQKPKGPALRLGEPV